MSAPFTKVIESPDGYTQYKKTDVVQSSLYDLNMSCDPSLRFQNKIIFIVDSKNRQPNEEPNKYLIKFPTIFKDVISVELKNSNIPNSEYIINDYNNMFYFQDSHAQINSDQYYKIQIPVGNYPITDSSADSIQSLLQQALNLSNLSNTYTVTVDPNKHIFNISQTSGSGVFRILFVHPKESACCDTDNGNPVKSNKELPNHMGRILGFKPTLNLKNHVSYTAPYLYNLRPSKYIVLRIKNLERVHSTSSPVQDAFCILSIDSRFQNYQVVDNVELNNEVFQKDWGSPIPSLDRFEIEFTDENGNPVNFRGRDHFMTFEIVSLSRYSNYAHYGGKK